MNQENPSPKPDGYQMEDWQEYYDADDLKWDLGEVSPPLKRLWEEGRLSPGKTLVPGCGQGHEVMFFAQQGFEVTGVDYAPGAVERLSAHLEGSGLKARVIHSDLFELGAEHDGFYDLILEQTCFCAIHPGDRVRYVDTMRRVLKPGGLLAGLFYETGEPDDGPPFNTTEADLIHHFPDAFETERLERCVHSIERRLGKEWLAIFRKK